MQVHKFNDSKGTHTPAVTCHASLAKVVECQMEIVNNHHSIVQGLQWVDVVRFISLIESWIFCYFSNIEKVKSAQYVGNWVSDLVIPYVVRRTCFFAITGW